MSDLKIFESIIPHKACEQIIREGVLRPQISAGIGKDNTKSEGRSTKVTFIDNAFTKSYIYELVTHNFKNYIIEEAEDLQFATYEEGDFYGYHKDADESNGRVLSVSVQLSNPSDYEGGELIFFYSPIEKAQGTVIIFPSDLYHQVTPVTKGKRYSLVQWFKGYESSNK
jgi:PKHD-type hydroxylase